MNLVKTVKSLCTPAKVYFLLSCVSIFVLIVQNLGNTKKYCVGNFTCSVTNTLSIFKAKAVYVLFWTFILQKLCDFKYTKLAWLILLFPLVLMFVTIGLFVLELTVDEIKHFL